MPRIAIKMDSGIDRYSGVGEEFLLQNLSFSLLTQTGRLPATPVQVANVCWREQNAAPIE